MNDNLIGQKLGKYELRQLLGQGGMGSVYRAFQADLKREVAVKVLTGAFLQQPGFMERFIREAQTAASLEHPHIVSVYDYGTDRQTSYVVMRLLSGGTLAERLNQAQSTGRSLPSLRETSKLLYDLASALDYAHSQGIIHRDIKTSNVMFDNQGNAYIVDFGIAKLMGENNKLTGTGIAMGTPTYMSPEQWQGANISPAADQYALGVLIYIMITGREPFQAQTPYELLHKHMHEMPTPLLHLRPQLPQNLDIVIGRALSKNPSQRYHSCTAFAQAFESVIAGLEGEQTNFFDFKISHRPSPTPYASYTPSGMTQAPKKT
ncbi:MAG: serine/threonine protein kinase, partial [Anaerolineae bacterium]|nr:serine/threonine protein kinase [Anaerolineae bacterium]